MFKKNFVVFLSVMLLCVLFAPVSTMANQGIVMEPEDHDIQPMWTYINTYTNTFDMNSSGRATIETILTSFEADEIRVEANLQQYKDGKWNTIKTWTNTSDGITCGIGEYWYVMKGYSYRLYSVGKVYVNGVLVEQTSYTSHTENYF